MTDGKYARQERKKRRRGSTNGKVTDRQRNKARQAGETKKAVEWLWSKEHQHSSKSMFFL